MARLVWGARTERFFEAGVDQGVLYPLEGIGVAWPGLISVTESPQGGLPKPHYLDGVKYLNIASAEEFNATIVCYAAPAEFGPSDGVIPIHNGLFATQQPRKAFGFSYRTRVGNEIEGPDLGYKIHLVYGALAAPTAKANTTLGDSADPIQMSWAISTLPPSVTGVKRTAHFVVDSRYADPVMLAELEDLLYGTEGDSPVLPTPDQLINIFLPPLAVAKATQTQTADNVVLTQHHILAVDDAAQAQTVDNVVLVPN